MTTILAVRRPGDGVTRHFAMGGDGQVSMGPTMAKGDARKVRRLGGGRVLAGFAGATADAFTLLDRLEGKLEASGGQLVRAAVDLARDWRTDRYLRRLEALMVVADRDTTLMLSGQGDVIEPETTEAGTVIGIGSGGNYAAAAARALLGATTLDAAEIVRRSLLIAASIDVYTNDRLTIETFDA